MTRHLLFVSIILALNSLNMITIRADGDGSGGEESYHLFNCTEDNRKEHFEKMGQYVDHVIPILELMSHHTDSVSDEHKKHKLDIKAIVAHFKKYNQTKEILRQKCDDSNTKIEECCQEIVSLEKKFHDEMDSISHQQQEQASK